MSAVQDAIEANKECVCVCVGGGAGLLARGRPLPA